jgi:hydroxymethylpyrimidine pyrophosphatase-like HAD family hydrolase
MPQLIACFDLDGTLFNKQGQIHPRDREILADPPGEVLLVPATGRPLTSVKRTFARNGLYAQQPLPFPLVLQNGAALYLPGEILVAHFPFDAEIQSRLIQEVRGFPEVTFLFMDQREVYILYPHPFGLEAIERWDFPSQPFEHASREAAFSKLMCLSTQPAFADSAG